MPPVANCFATDRSKTVTPRFLIFVNCLWRLFENDYYMLSSLYFLAVWGRLCLLNVAIPDMHISRVFTCFVLSVCNVQFMTG